MPAEAPSPHLEMLSQISEERRRCQAELERAQLPALLCEHATLKITKSRRFPGEESRQRRLQIQARVRVSSRSRFGVVSDADRSFPAMSKSHFR